MSEQHAKDFLTTAWSLVEQATKDKTALNKLLSQYRPPLWNHLVRAQRFSESEADDVIQEFLTSRVLERDLLSQAKRDRGKFRWFLVTALNNFVTDRRRSQATLKASPDRAQAIAPEHEPVSANAEVGIAYEASWALTVLAEAIRRMEAECRSAKRPDLWIVFQGRACRIMQGQDALPYQALMESLRARDEKQAANIWGTAQVKFLRILRQELGDFGAEDVEEELRDLKTAIAACGKELLETLRLQFWSECPGMSEESAEVGNLSASAVARLFEPDELTDLSKEQRWNLLLRTTISPLVGDEARNTFLAVLEDSNPSREMLEQVKDFAKDLRGAAQQNFTTEAATTLYYVSIAVGLLKANELITDQERSVVERGFAWARSRAWLDAQSKQWLADAAARIA